MHEDILLMFKVSAQNEVRAGIYKHLKCIRNILLMFCSASCSRKQLGWSVSQCFTKAGCLLAGTIFSMMSCGQNMLSTRCSEVPLEFIKTVSAKQPSCQTRWRPLQNKVVRLI
jgi:hypothetical protein